MKKAYIRAIEYYLPERVARNSPDKKTTQKIGILSRHIAANDEYASDMAAKAAERLIESTKINRNEIDFLIYCTQSPDYYLPTTACIIQDRLKLPSSCGAFDYNLGCSGYVYGLSIAKGLIETGIARNIMLLTGDTYSKYINDKDRSVNVIFGDAATATLISTLESETDLIGPFVFGTDGSGAENLIVHAGGVKEPITESSLIEKEDNFGNVRSRANLYMNGPEIFNFTLKEIPESINRLLQMSENTMESYDYFIFHQANKYMLEHLRKKLEIDQSKFPIFMEDCGNTVSSTIPIVLKRLIQNQSIQDNANLMLVGFGVGYSWATCDIKWITT